MDLVQIGRLSFTLVADAVSGKGVGNESEDTKLKCAQLSSSTAMKSLLHAAQDAADISVNAAASGGESEVEFLRVVAPLATIAASDTAAAAGRSISQASTPHSAGAASAPAHSTKHRSVMRGSKGSCSSSSSYHAKQTLEKLDRRSHKQQQQQRRSEDTTARRCTNSGEDSNEEDSRVDSAQSVLHVSDADAAADSDSSDVYESYRH
jgi:hypothetical protein